ncbi:MAG: DUF1127 domain-containing protein [Pseudomonadota bacterium]|nr:DUF1127 domain-containing protein [Pseudomonadota bacterium]
MSSLLKITSRLSRWWQSRRRREALSRLSDRQLEDIGVSRTDAGGRWPYY